MATTITVTATMRISIKCWPFTVGESWLFGRLARNRINRTMNRISAALYILFSASTFPDDNNNDGK